MKLSFALSRKPAPAPARLPPVFSALDDDPPDAAPPPLAAQNRSAESSKAARKRMAAEMQVDATVYEYDEVWDKMQDAKAKQREMKETDSKERKPKYIDSLLTSAKTRRLDYLRAEEKMIHREREAEGDQFKDKEAFVTQAYKDQMAELRKAEQEEKKLEAELEKKKNSGFTTGMSHFYRKLLDESESKHEKTVAATTSTAKIIGPQGPNLTITRPPELAIKSDIVLAREAKEQGKDIELNDDNQIVDKRELLSAGLNLAMANTRKVGLRTTGTKTQQDAAVAEALAHRAVGTAASKKDINERRLREIETQMQEEEERTIREKEQREREALERVVAKRNTEADVQSARERYLARKRQKLEEPATSADGAAITQESSAID